MIKDFFSARGMVYEDVTKNFYKRKFLVIVPSHYKKFLHPDVASGETTPLYQPNMNEVGISSMTVKDIVDLTNAGVVFSFKHRGDILRVCDMITLFLNTCDEQLGTDSLEEHAELKVEYDEITAALETLQRTGNRVVRMAQQTGNLPKPTKTMSLQDALVAFGPVKKE